MSGENNSDTNVDEESRHFAEVFDRIYEPESAESTSNDADVDDATSENCRQSGGTQTNQSNESIANLSHTNLDISEQPNMVHTSGTTIDSADNNGENSIRTRPSSAWIGPRISFLTDNIETSLNITSSSDVNEQNENGITVVANALRLNPNGSSLIIGSTNQNRDSARRLVYLDQQYCASMPTALNPTEESQMELFNQDGMSLLQNYETRRLLLVFYLFLFKFYCFLSTTLVAGGS